jgi:small subunit ribosomal protein S2
VREAKRLGIATAALIDTDSDPSDIDLPIPGNDDGIRSIELILKHLADAVIEGKGVQVQPQVAAVSETEPQTAGVEPAGIASVSVESAN